MAALLTEQVLEVKHWTDRLFSFRTTRDSSFRFSNGHFTMIGLQQETKPQFLASKPIMRAYSITSANHEDYLEFFSIKVADGPLTSKLQHIKPGDELLISSKSTGTLVLDHLLPGRNLYLVSTGTGLAPFISIIKDPAAYEAFDNIILTHCCRHASELAYQDLILQELPNHEYLGEAVRDKLIYYPTVTREDYKNTGRLTDLFATGKLQRDIGLDPINLNDDRFMICGSPSMLKQFSKQLSDAGFSEATNRQVGHYAVERAFVES